MRVGVGEGERAGGSGPDGRRGPLAFACERACVGVAMGEREGGGGRGRATRTVTRPSRVCMREGVGEGVGERKGGRGQGGQCAWAVNAALSRLGARGCGWASRRAPGGCV
jgi:hypothetical protein